MGPFDEYILGFRKPFDIHRYHSYRAGLMDVNEIAVFYQDMIESECVPAVLLHHAVHFIERGLCHLPDQQMTQ